MRTRLLQFALILSVSLACFGARPLRHPRRPARPLPPAPAEKSTEPAVTVQGTEPTGAGVSRTHDTLSVDFPDEDIRTILRNVADLFELNLVIPDTLQGKTSIKLRDVTWRQIFEVILTPVGYTYIEQGSHHQDRQSGKSRPGAGEHRGVHPELCRGPRKSSPVIAIARGHRRRRQTHR